MFPDGGGLVRSVELKTITESGVVSHIKRAVQRLVHVLLIPTDEQQNGGFAVIFTLCVHCIRFSIDWTCILIWF